MKKGKIYLTINDFSFEEKYEIIDNCIKFVNNETNYLFDINNICLIKEDNNNNMTFDFKNKLLKIMDKSLNKNLNLNLIINNLQILKNKIIISYQIQEEVFNLQLLLMEE